MIKFKDLSAWLKIAVLAGWFEAALLISGFILGFLGYLIY